MPIRSIHALTKLSALFPQPYFSRFSGTVTLCW